ncbi:MAG: hypothetical protein ACJAWS_001752 [Oleiphilaceae bacterium]|jgi:hypothetical protein
METFLMTFTRKLFRKPSFTTSAFATTAALILNLSVFSSPISAAEGATTSPLESIYQAHINSYYSINGFYNFSANQGDQKHLSVIVDATDKIDGLIEKIQESGENASDPESFDNAANAWNKYQQVLNMNIKEVKKTGYPDLRLAADMATENISLNQTLDSLYSSLAKIPSIKPNQATEVSRKTGLNLALMMTKYSARTTSTVSQVYSGGDMEITIDSLAKQFESNLNQLISLSEGNEKALDLLDSALTKWDFIKSSYINYNENRVNFIVNLYSKKIISDIDLALETL